MRASTAAYDLSRNVAKPSPLTTPDTPMAVSGASRTTRAGVSSAGSVRDSSATIRSARSSSDRIFAVCSDEHPTGDLEVAGGEHLAHRDERDVEVPQPPHDRGIGELAHVVRPESGLIVDDGRFEDPLRVVGAQRLDRDGGRPRERPDGHQWFGHAFIVESPPGAEARPIQTVCR